MSEPLRHEKLADRSAMEKLADRSAMEKLADRPSTSTAELGSAVR